MAENTSTFTGAAADGTALTAVYLTQPAANVAIGLVFAGSDLPHIVHWGRRSRTTPSLPRHRDLRAFVSCMA